MVKNKAAFVICVWNLNTFKVVILKISVPFNLATPVTGGKSKCDLLQVTQLWGQQNKQLLF